MAEAVIKIQALVRGHIVRSHIVSPPPSPMQPEVYASLVHKIETNELKRKGWHPCAFCDELIPPEKQLCDDTACKHVDSYSIMTPSNRTKPTARSQLESDGFAVVPVLSKEKVEDTPGQIESMLKSIPYFKTENFPQAQPVAGGFGACGDPASFHSPEIRRLRQICHDAFVENFGGILEANPESKLEQLFDRLLVRRKGQYKTFGESYHRDLCPTKGSDFQDGDQVFGGWLNCNANANQSFICVPGTHLDPTGYRQGFSIEKPSIEQMQAYRQAERVVVIEPGEMLVFRQELVHRVASSQVNHDIYRLFTAFRITTSSEPLFPLTKVFEDQAVPLLKSGQKPAMYPQLWKANWLDKLIDWSNTLFKSEYLESYTVGSGPNQGMQCSIAPKYMTSMRELSEKHGFAMYPEYSDAEKRLFRPSRGPEERSSKRQRVIEVIEISDSDSE